MKNSKIKIVIILLLLISIIVFFWASLLTGYQVRPESRLVKVVLFVSALILIKIFGSLLKRKSSEIKQISNK